MDKSRLQACVSGVLGQRKLFSPAERFDGSEVQSVGLARVGFGKPGSLFYTLLWRGRGLSKEHVSQACSRRLS